MRQIVLDTETTGLETADRVIEIGCVELIDRVQTDNNFHYYLRPDNRKVNPGAFKIHGISDEFLSKQQRFADIADEFLAYIKDAELIIHNAKFDVGFLDRELDIIGHKKGIREMCGIIDTLLMAQKKHRNQKNNLDALCKRYLIDNSSRTKHGALLDSEILAEVYIALTSGQKELDFSINGEAQAAVAAIQPLDKNRASLKVIQASSEELDAHQKRLDNIKKTSDTLIWQS